MKKEMIKIKDLDTKTKIIIIVIAIIMLITVIVYFIKNYTKEDIENNFFNDFEIENVSEDEEIKNQIIVHVTGEVKYSGVVTLNEGDRVVDAILAAGGETENADLSKLNLAYVLSDGEKIYVPNKNDSEEDLVTNGNNSEKENKLVNINTATVEELSSLPGIGQALAERIVMYRMQNGKFENIEAIKNVSGIGDSKFNNIKDMIKV